MIRGVGHLWMGKGAWEMNSQRLQQERKRLIGAL